MPDRERYYDQSREGPNARDDGRYGPEDQRQAEARTFEPRRAYRSEFAEGEPARRPEHEISEAEYRRRRGYYRGADFSQGASRAPERDPRADPASRRGTVYSDYLYPQLDPYNSWWGIGPNFGFGHDLHDVDRVRPDVRTRAPAEHRRHFWDKAADDVSSMMGDEAAHIRREMDRGEHAGRGPKGYKRSDSRIKEDVSDRLAGDSWLDASEIEIEVKDGEVTLSGKVASRNDRKRAELWAESISGVDHVQNNLRVDRDWNARDRAGGEAEVEK